MVTVHLDFDGIRVEGQQYTVWVHPLSGWRATGDATLSIGVDARSSRWDGWARLTHDMPHAFALGDVELADTPAGDDELRCLRAQQDDLPAWRPGFVFTLEPGMRAFLATELPRVDQVSRLAGALRGAVEPHLGRALEEYAWSTLRPHEATALVSVASAVILRGRTPAEALAYAVLLHDGRWAFSDEGDDPQYAELGSALRQADVQNLLSNG